MLWKVIADHKAVYPNPINVTQNDSITLNGREDNWDGHRWLWAIAGDGREGWVPDDLPIGGSSNIARCAYDYSAAEISVKSGETLKGTTQRHGWLWCRNNKDTEGWVPIRCLVKKDNNN